MLTSSNNNVGPFGDTTLTKVFVGGLAWETPNDALYNHFVKYGEILEAVIILDKATGRSKGYGFVTYEDPESARKACEDQAPVINGRRANCNLASTGARRKKSLSDQHGLDANKGPRSDGTITPPPLPSHIQWYYPAIPVATSPYANHHHRQTVVPYYCYDLATYKGYMGGAYVNRGQYTQLYPGQSMVGANQLLAMYHNPTAHHWLMGLPAHSYSGPMARVPVIVSKPTINTPSQGINIRVGIN